VYFGKDRRGQGLQYVDITVSTCAVVCYNALQRDLGGAIAARVETFWEGSRRGGLTNQN